MIESDVVERDLGTTFESIAGLERAKVRARKCSRVSGSV
jgi:hypothetical protein